MRRIILILPILLLMLAQTAPQAGAQGAVVVRVTPATLTIPLNGTSDVALEVVGVEGLYGFDVTLTFDPAVVEVVDANPDKQGVQVSFGTFMEPGLSVRDSADNAAGIVRYAMTQLNPSEAKNGSGNLVVIKLRGKAAGSSQLVLTEVALAARDATEIPSTTQPGQVTITTAGGNQPTTTPIPTQAPPTPVPTAGPVPTDSTAAPTQPPEPTLPPATATGQPVAELAATPIPPTATPVPQVDAPTPAASTATPAVLAAEAATTAPDGPTPVATNSETVVNSQPTATVQEVAAVPAATDQPTAVPSATAESAAVASNSNRPETTDKASADVENNSPERTLLNVGAGALGIALILAVIIGIVLVVQRRSRSA